MIAIARSVIRQFRAVVRRMIPGRFVPLVFIHGDRDGARLQCSTQDVSIELFHPVEQPLETVSVPFVLLADCEGRGDSLVTFSRRSPSNVEMTWNDRGIPQSCEHTMNEENIVFPLLPQRFAENPPTFWEALDQAIQSAAKDSTKYVINHVLLRGQSGEIVSTDTHQLLIQSGFRFPWSESFLIPRVARMPVRELPQNESVLIGKTDNHVTLKSGRWTFCFKINKEGRFPPTDQILPRNNPSATRLRLDAHDAAALVRALPGMPGHEEQESMVTVDLNGHAAIRSRAAGQTVATELLLSYSNVEGKPVRFTMDRSQLLRVGELGLDTLIVQAADKPLLFQSDTRKFLAMPLSPKSAIAHSDTDTQVHSSAVEKLRARSACVNAPRMQVPQQQEEIVIPPQPQPISPINEEVKPMIESDNQTASNRLEDEAVAIQKDLRVVLKRVQTLTRSIFEQRKQHRRVRATLNSLKELQHVEV